MRNIALIMIIVLAATPAVAQQGAASERPSLVVTMGEVQDSVMESVAGLQTKWAEIKYGSADKDTQIARMSALGDEAGQLVAAHPERPEPKIWQAIILSSEAGLIKGLSALPKVKQAKSLLEEAAKIDFKSLQGSAYTSLGSLYYQVPGWPIAFGDNDKAKEYLQAALQINPDGIDPNYFYGDFLIHQKKYADAIPVLEKALAAHDRPGRTLADEGRRQEIRAALVKARKEAGVKSAVRAGYN